MDTTKKLRALDILCQLAVQGHAFCMPCGSVAITIDQFYPAVGVVLDVRNTHFNPSARTLDERRFRFLSQALEGNVTSLSGGLPYSNLAIPHTAGSAPAQHSAARADFAGMLACHDA
eukprot:6173521-Pleurochrysis_carterae.AAC.2